MRILIALLMADLKRALFSFHFFLSTLFIVIVMFISCVGFMSSTSDVVELLGHALSGSGSTFFIFCIAPVLPYGMSFASDMEDRVIPFWRIRAGIKKYAASKFIASIISSFLTVGIGIYIFVMIMSLFFPLFTIGRTGSSYAALLDDNMPGMYILVMAIHNSLSATLFAGMAMVVSSFIPNKFTVLSAPIAIYWVLIRVSTYISIPRFLEIGFLVQGIYDGVRPMAAFLYKAIPVMVLVGILLSITVRQIDKKVGEL